MKKDIPYMQASDWQGQDPTNWIVTEKFDGFFARWTGSKLITRTGVDYHAPDWFTEPLPAFSLDCELWAGYGKRTTLNNCEEWRDPKRWANVKLIAFDVPNSRGGYQVRHDVLVNQVDGIAHHIACLQRWVCSGKSGLIQALQCVHERSGEGLVIRHPDALYTPGRVTTMLKVKTALP